MTYLGNQPADVAVVIADGAVDTAQLAADAVENAKIADGQVDTEHLAADAVEAAGLASNSVVNASVTSDAAIAYSKLGTIPTFNQNTTGSAATATLASTVTVADSTANTNFPVVFHSESNALYDDTGALRYNPSTGELLVPKLTVAGTTTTVDTVTMNAANAVIFEGATADAHETTLTITDPTADRTITLQNATGTVAFTSDITSFNTDAAQVFNESGNDVDFRVEGSGEINALFVQGSDGFIGIGTSAPEAELHIGSTGVHLILDSVTTSPDWALKKIRVSTSEDLQFGTWTGGDTFASKVAFTEAGNVGIGTTDPSRKLHVYGATGNDVAWFQSDGDAANIVGLSSDGTGIWSLGGNKNEDIYVDQPQSGYGYHFRIAGLSPTTVLRLQSDGKVGINTTSPDNTLTLASQSGDVNLKLEYTGQGQSWDQNSWFVRTTVACRAGNGTHIMRWNSSDYDIENGAGSQLHANSDVRLKKNITTIPNALDTVKSLRGVTYKWKSAKYNYSEGTVIEDWCKESNERNLAKTHYGFIAQEVQPVVPDLVHVHQDEKVIDGVAETDILGVDDRNGFEAIMIEAIKELSAKVEALESV